LTFHTKGETMRLVMLAAAAAVFAVSALAGSSAQAQQAPYAPYAGGAKPSGKDAKVDALKAAAAKLEKELKAKPNDAKLKMQTAEALYKAGNATMLSPNLDRKLKYKDALVYFRKCLALNPKHKQAAEEKATIEMIYKSMGRPIPQ
jgi:cytochrome c-type biogenesis protein CcmH/NrfG